MVGSIARWLLQVQLLHLKSPYMTSYLGHLVFSIRPVAYSSDFSRLREFVWIGVTPPPARGEPASGPST